MKRRGHRKEVVEIMSELVHIGNSDISVKEYNGQRVVTFKDIDMVHGRPDGTASRNFRNNRERFIEGEDFFKISPDEIRRTNLFDIPDKATTDYALITEQGYLMLVKSFTDDLAWEVQRQLVNGYFRVRKLATDLSPQMQMLYGMLDQMAQTERQAKEAKEIAQKAIDTTENIKEAVKPIFDNWREEINKKVRKIQYACGKDFKSLTAEMYSELERRAGCDLSTRLRNKKQRMIDSGCTKGEIDAMRKINMIEEDKKLKEIYTKIVSEYEMKYCA